MRDAALPHKRYLSTPEFPVQEVQMSDSPRAIEQGTPIRLNPEIVAAANLPSLDDLEIYTIRRTWKERADELAIHIVAGGVTSAIALIYAFVAGILIVSPEKMANETQVPQKCISVCLDYFEE
jgi:hypothetical protein